MELDCHNVLLETIYDHLSTRRRARWVSRYQQIGSAKTSSEWRLGEVWNRLVLRTLTDEKEGILASAKGLERESIARVADLYQRLVDGNEPAMEEWKEAERCAFHNGTAKHVLRSWRVYFWLIVMVVAIGFAVAYCIPVVKGWALIASLIAWWSHGKANKAEQLADVPIRASRLRILAAWQTAKWYAESPDTKGILEFELRDGSEDYTAQEEWMAKTLTMMADAITATSAAFSLEAGLAPEDEDGLATVKQDYWNWLSEVLLQVLRESNTSNILATALGN